MTRGFISFIFMGGGIQKYSDYAIISVIIIVLNMTREILGILLEK